MYFYTFHQQVWKGLMTGLPFNFSVAQALLSLLYPPPPTLSVSQRRCQTAGQKTHLFHSVLSSITCSVSPDERGVSRVSSPHVCVWHHGKGQPQSIFPGGSLWPGEQCERTLVFSGVCECVCMSVRPRCSWTSAQWTKCPFSLKLTGCKAAQTDVFVPVQVRK